MALNPLCVLSFFLLVASLQAAPLEGESDFVHEQGKPLKYIKGESSLSCESCSVKQLTQWTQWTLYAHPFTCSPTLWFPPSDHLPGPSSFCRFFWNAGAFFVLTSGMTIRQYKSLGLLDLSKSVAEIRLSKKSIWPTNWLTGWLSNEMTGWLAG